MIRSLKLDDPRYIRLQALKDAAKAVCPMCSRGGKPVVDKDASAYLVHLAVGYPPRDCRATPIYDIISDEGL